MTETIRNRQAFTLLLVALATGCDPGWEGSEGSSGSAGSSAGSAGTGGTSTSGGSSAIGGSQSCPGFLCEFQWTSSEPLIAPIPDDTHPILSVKDPSVVYHGDRWHVFATTANEAGSWSMVYLSFADFNEAGSAQPYYLDNNPALRGYHAAPQVFFFRPQNKWYLIFQSGQPQYSTTDDITRPETWSTPVNFFAGEPATVTENKGSGSWLDFWVICDAALCHLFFTDDNGTFYRSQTPIESFPAGFNEPVIAIRGTKETLFEGGATYAIKDNGGYLTLIEAFGLNGNRFYRSFFANSLAGEWTPLAHTWAVPFAGSVNVSFGDGIGAWTQHISHGELLRDGNDETLTIAPDDLRFLYQGVDPTQTGLEYFRLPYRLALLTQVN